MRLFMPMQRYKFESNSQLPARRTSWPSRCLCQCKDTNLKAIHNSLQFLRQREPLFMPMQRYKFESNSQPFVSTLQRLTRCLCQCKDTNLKAIHNRICRCPKRNLLFMPMQRYKFESNSQPASRNRDYRRCCLCQCKDTNLKAIHNL